MKASALKPWPFVTILMIGAFALISACVIPGSGHGLTVQRASLVFLLGIYGWLYVAYGTLRRSLGIYTAGTGFGYLALARAFAPDEWLAAPELFLLGLTTAFGLAMACWFTFRHRGFLNELALLCCCLAVVPLVLLPPHHWATVAPSWVKIPLAVALVLVAFGCFRKRQRITGASMATWTFYIVLCLGLLTGAAERVVQTEADSIIRVGLYLLGAVFMAELLQVERQLRRGVHQQLDASLKDALTGVGNRRALELHAPQIIRQSHEASRATSLIMADIDHFKQVNDKYGHLAGDAVLKQMAERLSAQVRKSDLVARYGGEEFAIVLPGAPLGPALRLAERMRHALESDPFTYEDLQLRLTASFGVITSFPEEPMSLTTMIQRADTNLYRAKYAGRNRVMTDEISTH